MRLAAHIGVLDEIDLIGPCIEHLRALGVEEFIVCDMASADGTREYLAAQEGPDFRVIDSSNAEPSDGWLRRNADVIRESGADWMLLIDADEFPLVAGGDLRRAFSAIRADAVRMRRHNVVLREGGLCTALPPSPRQYAELDLYVTPMTGFAPQLDATDYWLRLTPLPKVAVRPSQVVEIHSGMHDVTLASARGQIEGVRDIILAHAALSTYERLARKIDHVSELFRLQEAQLPESFGWHWRRWIELSGRGELGNEFLRSCLSHEQVEALRARGEIASAASLLRSAEESAADAFTQPVAGPSLSGL
jgi:hypothetical protein